MNLLRAPFAVGAFFVRQVGGVGAQLLRAVVDRGHPGHDRSRPDDRLRATPSAPPPAPPGPPTAPPSAAPPAPAPPQPQPQPPAARLADVGDPVEPGPEVRVEGEPWPGYEALRAAEIIARLRESDASTRAVVRRYEQLHRQRKTVLKATER